MNWYWVCGAGVLAGAMNALAGGGTFVTLPALIAAGVPSVQANTSSTVALYPSQLFNVWIYRDGLKPFGGVSLRALSLVTLIGGAAGAILLLETPTQAFDVALPWLMLGATVALAFARRLGEVLRRHVRVGRGSAIGIQFLLGIYVLARGLGAAGGCAHRRLCRRSNRQACLCSCRARRHAAVVDLHHAGIFREGVSLTRVAGRAFAVAKRGQNFRLSTKVKIPRCRLNYGMRSFIPGMRGL